MAPTFSNKTGTDVGLGVMPYAPLRPSRIRDAHEREYVEGLFMRFLRSSDGDVDSFASALGAQYPPEHRHDDAAGDMCGLSDAARVLYSRYESRRSRLAYECGLMDVRPEHVALFGYSHTAFCVSRCVAWRGGRGG